VFVSSHLMSEMALTADHLVGHRPWALDLHRHRFESSPGALRSASGSGPPIERAAPVIDGDQVEIIDEEDGALSVSGISASDHWRHRRSLGDLSARTLTPDGSLEDAFMELTRDSVEYHGVSSPVEMSTSRHLFLESRTEMSTALATPTPRDRASSRPERAQV